VVLYLQIFEKDIFGKAIYSIRAKNAVAHLPKESGFALQKQ